MLKKTGIPNEGNLARIYPDKKRLIKGPVVIIECFQNIPCDPCAASCRFGAIKAFEDINDLPKVDFDKCTGCGICISSCPGLAIFVLDESYSETESLLKLPYEMLPLPKKGDYVWALDRDGQKLCKVIVDKFQKIKNKTNIVSILVPKNISRKVRSVKVEDNHDE